MKTIKYKYAVRTICAFVFLCNVTAISAQNNDDDEERDKLERAMVLEREYDPTVQDANKVNILPAIKEPVARKVPINYASFSMPLEPEKQITLLPSGNVMTNIDYNKKRGYLNLAGGTALSFDGDFGYHILNTEKDKLNFWYSHRSNFGKVKYLQIDEKEKAKINDNLVGLDFTHGFRKSDFSLGVKYGYFGYNYYGILPVYAEGGQTNPADLSTMQANQVINGHIGVQSKKESVVGYIFDVNYVNFSRKYGINKDEDGLKEHNVTVLLGLNSTFRGNQVIGIGAELNYLGYDIPENALMSRFQNRFFATINPYYGITGDNWHVRLGAKVMFYTGKDNWDKARFFASPDVKAGVTVAEKTELYFNAGGYISNNSAYELSKTNRYINPTEAIMPSRTPLDAKLGLQSGVAPGFWFDVFGGFRMTANDCFFIPERTADPGNFGAMSSSWGLDSKLLYAGAALKYNYQKLLEFRLKGVYNYWDVDEGDDTWIGGAPSFEAYYRPEVEFTAGIDVKPIEPLCITAEYYLASGRHTIPLGIDEKMKNINELNLTCSYMFNDTFSLYARANNLLFQKYDLWYGMPAQGFNFMVGLNLNF